MPREKKEEWDIAERLGVTLKIDEEDKKIESVDQVLTALEDCPDDFRPVYPKMRHFKKHEDYFVMRIRLAEKRVEKAKEDLEDFEASKDPKTMGLKKVKKHLAEALKLRENLIKMGVPADSIPQFSV